MIDSFSAFADSANSPSRAPFAIVPSDSVSLPACPKAIYVGTGGALVLRGVDGEADVRFANVPSGAVIDVRAIFVRATGTTAGDLVGLA
ncbi:spike base protein, RCAP_Rcc01079 family [Sphingomonas aracearum]|uniref:Uncharacterized protein n=1 Tax=Sphingomonas aracearum TaxID=2283317 RepID=A0A369VUR3_9SPHN|nr:hypothetical protein [Sphingomonas aracearum]RDE05297.1 hypothetical protein DVW87_08500 [Sphingomonas aracearum]